MVKKGLKKPWFKRWSFWIVILVIVTGFGTLLDTPDSSDKIEPQEQATKKVNEPKLETKVQENKKEEDSKVTEVAKIVSADKKTVVEPVIDTSVFEYALETKVTNAIDINDHVTVFVQMSEELNPGLATQHVVTQTYDFIQQNDVADAKTITIAVKQGAVKITQYTVSTSKFVPNDNTPMTHLVMAAAEIDFMTEEVKEFGKTMESW